MDKETFKEMNYLPNNLTFDDGVAFLNDFSLIDIASEHGTPLYLYDWDNIENNILEFTNAFGDDVLYRYAAVSYTHLTLPTKA